jgi:hypothetical protein
MNLLIAVALLAACFSSCEAFTPKSGLSVRRSSVLLPNLATNDAKCNQGFQMRAAVRDNHCSTTTGAISSLQKSMVALKEFAKPIFASFAVLVAVVIAPAKALAASAAAKVKGWDLYGRVPYDDWLFSNWRLTDPNLLKRSFVEAVRSMYGLYS